MRLRLAAVGLLCALLAGCQAPEPAPVLPDHEQLALDMFAAAAAEDSRVAFAETHCDRTVDDADWPTLLDGLEALGRLEDPTIVGSEPLDDAEPPAEMMVDLEVAVGELTRASVSVRLQRTGDEWGIVWFQGPGTEWPQRRTPRDQGLSTSAPPETP